MKTCFLPAAQGGSWTALLTRHEAALAMGAVVAAILGGNFSARAQSAGSIRFGTNVTYVAESSGTVFIPVLREFGADGTVTVDYAASDGTATAGLDYVAESGTLTFLPGQTEASFTIPIIFDDVVESIETINLTLSNPTGGAVLNVFTNNVVSIFDVGPIIQIGFSAPTYFANESDGIAIVSVVRSGVVSRPVNVTYSTSDGSAQAGQDYAAQSGTLTFGPGETVKNISIPVSDDTVPEADETINLTLSNPTGGATFGLTSATLIIQGNDNFVEFSSAGFSATEFSGYAYITIVRTPSVNFSAVVNYATSDGTAKAGLDYAAQSGSLYFDPGVTNASFG